MQDPKALGETTIRVLVAEGSRIHTHLLAEALQREPGLDVSALESDPSELLPSIEAQRTDVLILSSNLEERIGAGFEVLRELRAAIPAIRAVLLLDSSTKDGVVQAFRAGARGVFSKELPAQVLSKCIRCVHDGQIWANSREMTIAIEALASAPLVRAVNASGMKLLSKRELQVVRSLAEGLTNREIAERLRLSQHTVKNYLFRVFDKLGVSSRMELLYMTLSENSAGPAAASDLPRPIAEEGKLKFGPLLRAAETGLPAAQLALSQMYLSRNKDSEDLVSAYTWCQVATRQAAHAGQLMAQGMTTEQVAAAQNAAEQWIRVQVQNSAAQSEEGGNTSVGTKSRNQASSSKAPAKTKEAHR